MGVCAAAPAKAAKRPTGCGPKNGDRPAASSSEIRLVEGAHVDLRDEPNVSIPSERSNAFSNTLTSTARPHYSAGFRAQDKFLLGAKR